MTRIASPWRVVVLAAIWVAAPSRLPASDSLRRFCGSCRGASPSFFYENAQGANANTDAAMHPRAINHVGTHPHPPGTNQKCFQNYSYTPPIKRGGGYKCERKCPRAFRVGWGGYATR